MPTTARATGTDKAGRARPLTRAEAAVPPATRVTHADRVIDAQSGTTKGELVAFYASVSTLMLPHLRARPVAFLRAPDGVDGAFFFQKHAEAAELPGVMQLDPALDPDHEPLLTIPAQRGLLSAAQMNVVEFHTWNATARRIAQPDRIVFDLDPGSGVTWRRMQEATQLLHGFLDELGLVSFAKTSGGKGMHVVVPLTPHLGWDAVRAFAQAIVRHIAEVIPDRFVARAGRRTGSARSSSTTCATASARPPSAPGRRARGRGWACPCRSRGTSWTDSAAQTIGRCTTSHRASRSATHRGPTTAARASACPRQ